MPRAEDEPREEIADPHDTASEPDAEARRRFFTRRNLVFSAALIALAIVAFALIAVVSFRTGVIDSYIKTQFTAKMAIIGITFEADVFRLSLSPLQLELHNATFNDSLTGDKLFFVSDANIGLTVEDLYAWQLTRDINVDSTDVRGAEVWVKFDENGRSNFANLVQDESGGNVNFSYDSVKFSLHDSIVHFGDMSRKISADANNVQFYMQPEDPAEGKNAYRYRIDLTATDSHFDYDGHPLDNIDLRAKAVADSNGADIELLDIQTPIGTTKLSGRLTDWKDFKYDLNVESSIDLTQASTIFPLGTAIRGVGNFQGHVTGAGENYKVDGVIDSQSLIAQGVYLKGVNIDATVEGTNSSYDANGKAVAELLTFGDFRVDFPKLTGNVRGTGTDFRWVGELEAAAAKSGKLTLGHLFLSDAVAEMKDRQLTASAGNGRAELFAIEDNEFRDLTASDLRFSSANGETKLSAPNATASSFKTKNFKLSGVRGRNLNVKDTPGGTDVTTGGLTAASADIKGSKLKDVAADSFDFQDRSDHTDVRLRNVRAGSANLNGTQVTGLSSPDLLIHDRPADTTVYADKLRVARVEASGAVLGSLNIAGVRLTIREGRVEGRSNDIDAGTVMLTKTASSPGGTLDAVKVVRPVFVLESSGRYRVTADMSLGGGMVGSVPLGAAQASVDANNDRVQLNNLNANVMDGSIAGQAVIAMNGRARSTVNADFSGLDLSKIIAVQGGRIIPLEGNTSGRVDLNFAGTDIRTASGTVNADITASAGDSTGSGVPINGTVRLSANSGVFNVDQANLSTPNSKFTADGRFDLRSQDSDLNIALNSTDASEVDRVLRLLNVSSELTQQLDSMEVTLAGNLGFSGHLTGNIYDPMIEGKASLDSVSVHGRELGAVSTDIAVTPIGIGLNNGSLRAADGGTVAFDVSIPRSESNNTSVNATLTNVNAGNLLAALPITLPERLRDFNGKTSGTVKLTGLPNRSTGEVNLQASSGTIAGQAFDNFAVKAVFAGSRVDLSNAEIKLGTGTLTASGNYDWSTSVFDLDLKGNAVPLPLLLAVLPQSDAIPTVAGISDFTAKATGDADRPGSYVVTFNGSAREVVVNENAFGDVAFNGNTKDQVLNAQLTATLAGRPQLINASVSFGNANLPIRVETSFDQSPLGPFFALVPQLRGISIGGTGTGTVVFGGDLAEVGADGKTIYSTNNLSGTANFSQLALTIQDTPLSATEPVVVRFDPRGITFDSAKFAGGGSNVTIAGTKAFTDDGINSLTVDGKLNLALLNAFPGLASADTFFSGLADVAIRISGPNRTTGISGTLDLQNASFATFVGSDRLTLDRLTGRILFTSNQAQFDQISGYLGGGKFIAGGGALIGPNLTLASFRMDLTGTNITVPLPQDFITTGDAKLEISGRRIGDNLSTFISGNIRARRSLYTKDIDLANIVGARREASLSSSTGSLFAPRFDLTIEGRDALIIKNNIADVTASASLRITGNADNPQISGRITANNGTVFFRKDRYIIQRAVLEFPPNTTVEPVINLQAESEIGGYQVFVNLAGPLTDTELLNATVRSSPALPQADVISLITTGNLSNTDTGIPTLAQSGINTAAEILADSIINNPARKATDKLFGLNVFEIDPIISGERLNPSARLTVGRQINNNLRVTYATNLSQDQQQVLALEYRVSNKLSFVAQYEQRSLSNVTRNRDNFSFEIRFRRRF